MTEREGVEIVLDVISIDPDAQHILLDDPGAPQLSASRVASCFTRQPWVPLPYPSEPDFTGTPLPEAIPLDWPTGNHGLLESPGSPLKNDQLPSSPAARATLRNVQPLLLRQRPPGFTPHVPILTCVNPSCAMLPPAAVDGGPAMLPFLLSGHNLEGCQVLVRLQTGRSLVVDQTPVVGSGSSTHRGATLDRILITVHGMDAPGCLLVECRSAGGGEVILGRSKAVLVVGEASMCREVRSMEEEEDQQDEEPPAEGEGEGCTAVEEPCGTTRMRRLETELQAQSNAVIRDLGSWIDFCRQASQASHDTAQHHQRMLTLGIQV